MPEIRLIAYATGLLMAIVLAGQLLRIKHTLARLLAVAMVAWALNCITLLILLSLMLAGGDVPVWRDLLTTTNALLLAVMPAMLYAWFLKVNGRADG